MKANEFITEAVKQRLDPKCWKGKHKEGTKIKGGVRVNNCVPNESQGVAEGDSGAKYRVKSIGRDAKGDYYISPSTEKKVYKSGVNKGDHENPNTGEIKKKVAEAGREGKDLDKIRDKYNKYDEAANPAQQAAIAIAKKKAGKK